jgi:hypothetical protein
MKQVIDRFFIYVYMTGREHRRYNKEKDNPEIYELAMLSAQDAGRQWKKINTKGNS